MVTPVGDPDRGAALSRGLVEPCAVIVVVRPAAGTRSVVHCPRIPVEISRETRRVKRSHVNRVVLRGGHGAHPAGEGSNVPVEGDESPVVSGVEEEERVFSGVLWGSAILSGPCLAERSGAIVHAGHDLNRIDPARHLREPHLETVRCSQDMKGVDHHSGALCHGASLGSVQFDDGTPRIRGGRSDFSSIIRWENVLRDDAWGVEERAPFIRVDSRIALRRCAAGVVFATDHSRWTRRHRGSGYHLLSEDCIHVRHHLRGIPC